MTCFDNLKYVTGHCAWNNKVLFKRSAYRFKSIAILSMYNTGDQNITLRVKSSPVELKASHIFLPIYSYPCQSYLGTYSEEGHHQLNETAFVHNGSSHYFLFLGSLTIQDAQIHYLHLKTNTNIIWLILALLIKISQ